MSSFGQILRELRKERGLTQTQLAHDVGLSFSTISMYERGEREPDFETTEQLADYFNVDFNYMLGKSPATTRIELNGYAGAQEGPPRPAKIRPLPGDCLSAHETELIKAYRAKPEMQSAVDTLLGLGVKDTPSIRVAACGGGVCDKPITANADEIREAIQEDDENLFVISAENNENCP